MQTLALRDVQTARQRIGNRVHVTPLLASTYLGQRCGDVRLSLKCESFQKTGSFKARGALNAILQLDDRAKAAGVVTVSAGNHAQALAWAASAAGVPSTVIMPVTASPLKAEASRGYGARVILHGTAPEAFARAHEIAASEGLTFVHPFDDVRVIAGAGTLGLEILEQCADADVIVVPIGGGGLISGVAMAIKESRPGIRIYGVEPRGAAAMRSSLIAGHAVRLPAVATIADGLAAPMAGDITYELVKRYVDDVILVDDAQIAEAMALMLTRAKVFAEAAGAAATAALVNGLLPVRAGDRVVSIVSGGNVDLSKLAQLVG